MAAKLHNTMGGTSDTVLNELAVIPTGVPSCARVVITVTPVPKRPKARRKSSGSISLLFTLGFITVLIQHGQHFFLLDPMS
jgi:hypothetical protein